MGDLDVPTGAFGAIPLSERGNAQAAALARVWTAPPDLIVTSPFERARRTAAPTAAHFHEVPVDAITLAMPRGATDR